MRCAPPATSACAGCRTRSGTSSAARSRSCTASRDRLRWPWPFVPWWMARVRIRRTDRGPSRAARRSAAVRRPAALHPLEQVGVATAHFELLVVALHADDLAPAQVARDARDEARVDERRAMDLPEQLRVDLVDQLLDRLADQGFERGRLHARVLLVGDE